MTITQVLQQHPPSLHSILMAAQGFTPKAVQDRYAARDTSTGIVAEHVLAALEGAHTTAHAQRHAQQVASLQDSITLTQTYEGVQWAILMASAVSPTGFGHLIKAAYALDVPFLAVVCADANASNAYFDASATSGLIAFADASFLLFQDGWLLSTLAEGAVYTSQHPTVSLLADIKEGTVALVAEHRPADLHHPDHTALDHERGFWTDAVAMFYDAEDPLFDPDDEHSWSSLHEDDVQAQALRVFVALGDPDATIDFTINAADEKNGTPGGVCQGFLSGHGIDVSLFADTMDALANLEDAQGGGWEYNDGNRDRKSGYSYHTTILSMVLCPHDRDALSAHEQLRMRTQLSQEAVSDPRLAGVKDRLIAALSPSSLPQDPTP